MEREYLQAIQDIANSLKELTLINQQFSSCMNDFKLNLKEINDNNARNHARQQEQLVSVQNGQTDIKGLIGKLLFAAIGALAVIAGGVTLGKLFGI